MADVPPPLDADAFRVHSRFVKSLARELARDGDEAEEVVARTLAAAVEQRPREGATLRGWFARVASRVFSRMRREESRRGARERVAARDERTESRDADPAEIAARAELIERVATVFASLDEPYRTTLYRRFYDEWSVARIAAHESVPADTVKSRVRRGLQRLRERLDAAHSGRRDEWRATAIAFAQQGASWIGLVKAKGVAAAAAIVVAGWLAWELPRMSAPKSPDMRTSATASDAANADEAGQAEDATRTPPPMSESNDPTRSAERTLPFASGRVVDEIGRPLDGVLVVAYSPRLSGLPGDTYLLRHPVFDGSSVETQSVATTDREGRFVVVKRPSGGCCGFYFVSRGRGLESWMSLEDEPGRNQEHRVVLQPGWSLRGQVRETESSPLVGAKVVVFDGDAENFQQRFDVGGDGAFDLPSVSLSICRVRISAPGYVEQAIRAPCDGDVDVHLVRASAIVDVVDAVTHAPLAGAAALVGDADEDCYRGRTLPEVPGTPPGRLYLSIGLVCIPTSPATRAVRVYLIAHGHHSRSIEVATGVTTEPPRLEVALQPGDDDPSISGRIVGAQRPRVELRWIRPDRADATIRDVDPNLQEEPPLLAVDADAAGCFVFRGLPVEQFRVDVKAQDRAPRCIPVTSPVADLEIPIVASTAIDALVVDATGAPVPDARVHVQSDDCQRWQATGTEADGHARFRGLPDGKLLLAAFTGDAPSFALDRGVFFEEDSVTLAPGEERAVTLRLVAPVDVTLHVRDRVGAAVEGARIEVARVFESHEPPNVDHARGRDLRNSMFETDSDGDVHLTAFPSRLKVRVLAGSVERWFEVTIPRETEAWLEVALLED